VIQWWKITGIILVGYALTWGLITPVPDKAILEQSIRNLFYHVPMWFGMILLLAGSLVKAIAFLSKGKMEDDIQSAALAQVGVLFGMMGIFTGMIWAKNTWGAYWTADPKLNSAAIGMLMYFTDSLHPGNGGNPGFNSYDLDAKLRLIFYPAVIGWTLIGYWIANLQIRIKKIELKQLNND